jgi:hypothetical protein
MRWLLWAGMAGAVVPAWSQAKTTLLVPPAPLLPQQAGEWTLQSEPTPEPPGENEGQLPAILKEDGLQKVERGTYRAGASGPAVTVVAREFVDATGAHAAYSFLQRPGSTYRGVGMGEETSLNGDRYLFRSGASLVEAEGGRGEKVEALLSRIQVGLPKISGPKGLSPLLPTLVPAKGLERDSVRYALGPVSYEAMGGVLPGAILGFDKAAEAVTAKYAGRGRLTMLIYPTPEIAGDHLRAIEDEVHKQGKAAGTVVMRRAGTLVMLTTGEWPLAEAKSLIEGIHPKVELTWNKPMPPEFHTEVRKTYSLLTSIAIFSGFGALAAIVLGLSLGAGRAAVRVLQGKPAASEPEFLRIDLSGRPTPLHIEGKGDR